MFPITDIMAALCLPCTAAVASSAASDSRRINSLPHNTVYSIPSTGTCAYTVPYRFVVSSARMANPDPRTIPYTVYALYPLTDSAEGCAL